MTGNYKSLEPEIKDGLFKYYDTAGRLGKEVTFLNNEINRELKLFYSNGTISQSANYVKGKLEGKSFYYYENGNLRREENYKNDIVVEGKCFTINNQDTTYFSAEVMPEFIGGEHAMFKYIAKNFKMPRDGEDQGIRGTVYISFEISKGGIVEKAIIKQGLYNAIDKEAFKSCQFNA